MRDYQPHKNNPYWLEPTVYKRVLSVVRDYDRMVRDYNNILHETASGDGQPRSSTPGDPVERKAERMDRLWQDIHAVELALVRVPEQYQKPIMQKVKDDYWPANVPIGKNGPGYWKKRFLYWVAENKHFV